MTIQNRVISQIYDPRGDVPESHSFIDVIEARILQINPGLLQFEMKLNAPVPVNPERNLIYVWLIDTDQNKETGQRHAFVGSEFNVRLAFYDGYWQGYIDDICPPYIGGRVPVFIDNDVISIIVDINLIEKAQRFNWEISADDGSMLDIADTYATAELSSNLPNPGEVSEILLSPSFIILKDGVTRALVSVTLKDITGTLLHNFSSVKFFVDYPSMISITDFGLLNASPGKFGFCWITAKVNEILSNHHIEVVVGSLNIVPPILLLSVTSNQTGKLTLQVRDAYGNYVIPSSINFYSSNPNIATVSNDGLVTAVRPIQALWETPIVTGQADGLWSTNVAVIRVDNNSLGITLDPFIGKYVTFYVPREPIQGFDYQKIFRDWDVLRITDLAYEIICNVTGYRPFNGGTQFLVNVPGRRDTVPCGASGNPIGLGTDVDKPVHGSCMIVAWGEGYPQWGVYFHEMGHNFLGGGIKVWQFMPGLPSDGVYCEGLATALGMYVAKMLQKHSSRFAIPQKILDNIMSSVWHFGSTPDLDQYLSKGARYSDMTPSVLDDMIDVICSRYGYESLYRFYSLFLPRDIPSNFTVDSETKQATLFVAALSAAVKYDLRTQFESWGFPIDNIFYKEIIEEVTELINQRLEDSPPITIHNYDGVWHSNDFCITLLASDDKGGIAEIYYRINNGPILSVTRDGPPLISLEGANNTLEYWSVTLTGNEEMPHKILADIKLDKTAPVISGIRRQPEDNVEPAQAVKVLVNTTDSLSGVKDVILSYNVDDSPTWIDVVMAFNATSGLYEGTIPGQQADTIIKYKIVAYDYAGNSATLDGMELYCAYQQQTTLVTFMASGFENVSQASSILIVDDLFYGVDQLPLSFIWEVGSEHAYAWANIVESTVEDRRYRLVSVSGLSNSSKGTITVQPEGGSVEAFYKMQYALSIGAEAGKGTTDPSPGMYWFDEGSVVNITAIPDQGYEFKMWRAIIAVGATYNRDSNPTTVWIGGPISLVVEFIEVFDYQITLIPSSISVYRGKSASVSVQVERTAGEARQKIELSLVSVPRGVLYKFDLESDTPPLYTTLTITASNDAPIGTYILTVRALYGEGVKENPLSVTIMEPERAWYEQPWALAPAALIAIAVVIAIILVWRHRQISEPSS